MILRLTILCIITYLWLASIPALAQEPDVIVIDRQAFKIWLQELRKEALKKGINQTTLDTALADVEPIEKVLKLDRKQPESTITFKEYLSRVTPNSRVRRGKTLLKENKTLLEDIARKYGVQPRFIVALWGIETDFGNNTGGFYIPAALATLAYDGRRSEFFRKELLNALEILDAGHISAKNMQGSWAGAMGQCQFMPSSFLNFAVDYNGDGRKDIWKTKGDLFASIANYLSQNGWDDDQTWGREVKLPDDFDHSLADVTISKQIKDWNDLGIRRMDGRELPIRELEASIVLPGGKGSDAFMVYKNYKNILKWNRSHYFATAVGLLSDQIE